MMIGISYNTLDSAKSRWVARFCYIYYLYKKAYCIRPVHMLKKASRNQNYRAVTDLCVQGFPLCPPSLIGE
jgi:hypothetical protein